METARHDSIDFFLGATTPAGFKGYFEPLRHEPGMQTVSYTHLSWPNRSAERSS